MTEQGPAPKGIGVIGDVVIDVADLERGGTFWSQILGVEVAFRHHQFWWLGSQNEGAPNIVLQRTDEDKVGKNRVHLDVNVGGGRQATDEERRSRVGRAAARLVEHGAAIVRDYDEHGSHWIVMHDPEGNEFCLQ